ncbi:MAG: threonine synthase [Chloroflexi bacterium]|nr:threonine synthase [Chloroflexota bacterium]MCL5074727.1 threonine synthase [Chloroflexota bacterium]
MTTPHISPTHSPRNVRHLKCVLCGREFSPTETLYTCLACGPAGILEVIYDYPYIAQRFTKEMLAKNAERSLWRYAPLLPISDTERFPPLQVGWTPLYPVQRLRRQLGLEELYVKDDGRNPTASLKDRASAVGIVKALELGAKEVTGASTGNAASSWAGASASLGLKSYIFVPEKAPKAKIAQLLVYGAKVFAVRGTYDQAFDLCIEATERFGWYNRNTAYNPYLVEGKKTVALEICEQLHWEVPDKVFVPVGDGCIISGVWKGFYDLQQLGFINRLPQLVACQAEGSQAIKLALESDGTIRPVEANTLADSISVSLPRNGVMAVRDVRRSAGFAVSVTDEEILAAITTLARSTGVFAEPAAAASLAALQKLLAQGRIDPKERIVLLATGNGLKDIESALKAVGSPMSIEPRLDDVEKALS